MSNLFAEAGMRGTFEALPPYDTVILPGVIYECLQVSTLRGLVASNEDPYELYYKPYGLSKELYDIDYASDVRIIALQSYTGQVVKVPASYVQGLPDPGGVIYLLRSLSVTLNALPAGVDLEALKQDISELIQVRLGVLSTIQEISYGPDITLTAVQHDALSAHRATVKTQPTNNLVRISELETLCTAQAQSIQQLERYIANTL